VLPDKIVYLAKKANNISQLRTTISFETKHIQSELGNKLFNESHVSLLFEKHNSIKTCHCTRLGTTGIACAFAGDGSG